MTKTIPTLLTAARIREKTPGECKYVEMGFISHRICPRSGRCTGCSTEEAALERSLKS